MLAAEPPLYEYQVGGSLPVGSPSYISRQCDDELYHALQEGEFCYVFNSRQMGKSSLRVRTTRRLQDAGIRTGVIDMTMCVSSQQTTPEQWYASILQELASSFRLNINLRNWWRARTHLSPLRRLNDFLSEVLLTAINQRIVIFIEEIDSILELNFPINDLFALIWECYNKRVAEPAYRRLSFTLLGVVIPRDLIADETCTPFKIGRAIELRGFRLAEALPLLPGLQAKVSRPEAILCHILEWTNGQPFLTQKLCKLILDACTNGMTPTGCIPPGKEGFWVEYLIRSQIANHWELQDEPEHLTTIAHRLLNNKQRAGRLVELYQQVLQSTPVTRKQGNWAAEWVEEVEEERRDKGRGMRVNESREQIELLLSGLVIEEQGFLKVRNRIYEAVFNLEWVDQQLKILRHPYNVDFTA